MALDHLNEQQLRELLLRSLDQPLSDEEQRRLDAALAESAPLRQEQRQLLEMRRLLSEMQAPAEPDFTGRVMAGIREKPLSAAFISLLPRVAAACMLLLLASLAGLYLAEGSLSTDAIIGLEGLAPEDAYTLLLE